MAGEALREIDHAQLAALIILDLGLDQIGDHHVAEPLGFAIVKKI